MKAKPSASGRAGTEPRRPEAGAPPAARIGPPSQRVLVCSRCGQLKRINVGDVCGGGRFDEVREDAPGAYEARLQDALVRIASSLAHAWPEAVLAFPPALQKVVEPWVGVSRSTQAVVNNVVAFLIEATEKTIPALDRIEQGGVREDTAGRRRSGRLTRQ